MLWKVLCHKEGLVHNKGDKENKLFSGVILGLDIRWMNRIFENLNN